MKLERREVVEVWGRRLARGVEDKEEERLGGGGGTLWPRLIEEAVVEVEDDDIERPSGTGGDTEFD